MKEFNDYQQAVLEFKQYDGFWDIVYPTLEIANEAGEVAGLVKKWIRGDYKDIDKQKMIDELGDVLFPMAMLCNAMNIGMNEIAARNIEKLKDRKRRGKIKGSGDNR